jgi:hypothetical protein
MKHTPTPWAVNYEGPARLAIEAADGTDIALGNLQCHDGDADEANMERIAACVNACEGIQTAQLRDLGHGCFDRMRMENYPRIKYHQELVEALHGMVRRFAPLDPGDDDGVSDSPEMMAARAVLTKAKGNQ